MKTSKFTTAGIIEIMHDNPSGITINHNGRSVYVPGAQTAGTAFQNISYQVSTARKIAEELNAPPKILQEVLATIGSAFEDLHAQDSGRSHGSVRLIFKQEKSLSVVRAMSNLIYAGFSVRVFEVNDEIQVIVEKR